MTTETRVYFNEFDPHAAEWTRNLIAAGLVAGGTVDERSIADVRAEDLVGHGRCHFFSGIAVWEYALRLAGWPDDRECWTGSCPCQPFSSAGKRKGTADERHLWPEFCRLIRERRPECVLGEQVASNDGYAWLDGVRADVEREGYAFAAADLPSACVGAPHRRQRLFWVAHAGHRQDREPGVVPDATGADEDSAPRQGHGDAVAHRCNAGRLADLHGGGLQRGQERDCEATAGESASQRDDADRRRATGPRRLDHAAGERAEFGGEAEQGGNGADDGVPGEDGRLGNSSGDGLQGQHGPRRQPGATERADGAGLADFWGDFDLLPCRDNKVRRSQSGLLPLVDGAAFLLADGRTREGVSRAKVLRGVGNAIVPQVAAKFIRAFMEVMGWLEVGP